MDQYLKKISFIGVVGASILLLSACQLLQAPSSTNKGTSGQSQTTTNAGNVITYASTGFAPSGIKVKVGEKVEFKNTSGSAVQINSAVHPTHTLYPELNIGAIAAGAAGSTVFNKPGIYKYHNHLNPPQNGTIEVE